MIITCREVTELHTAAAEGALVGWQRFAFHTHMRICPGCKRYRAQLDATVEVLKKQPHEAPRESLEPLIDALTAELDLARRAPKP